MTEDRNTPLVPEPPDKIAELRDDLNTLELEEAKLLMQLRRNRAVQELIVEEREEILTGREPEEVAIDDLIEACNKEINIREEDIPLMPGSDIRLSDIDTANFDLTKDVVDRLKRLEDYEDTILISAILLVFGYPDISDTNIEELDVNKEEDIRLMKDKFSLLMDKRNEQKIEEAIVMIEKTLPDSQKIAVSKRIEIVRKAVKDFRPIRLEYLYDQDPKAERRDEHDLAA